MLDQSKTIFDQIRSIRTVCAVLDEVNDEYLRRLLRELPAAGVDVILIDAGMDQKLLLEKTDPAVTLLIAGTQQTLALAAGTPMATVGTGLLLVPESDRRHDGSAASYGHGDTWSYPKPDILVENFEEVDVQFLDRIMKRAQGLPWTTVVTDRCLLREMTLDDMDGLFELYAGEGITDYVEPLYDRLEEEEYTKKYIEHIYYFYGYGMWVVIERATGKLMGRAGFSHQDLGEEIVLEMGYIIGVPWQRQGYATEICTRLVSFARTNLLDFETLNCFVEPENTASRRLMDKLGFADTGIFFVPGYGKYMLRYVLELQK